MSLPKARFNQVALSVADRGLSLAFYSELIGMRPVGGTQFKGRTTEAVQGMAGASSNVSWLMDDRPYFQLELFEFICPKGRARARERQAQDTGYSRLCFAVPDIDAVAARLGINVSNLHGKRTALVRDPDGICIQLIESDVPCPRLVGVAMSVPDLAVAQRSFVTGCGCVERPEDAFDWAALWGEADCDKAMLLLDGETLWLEISQYGSPPSAPWPNDYRLSDHGILNVALGFDSGSEIKARLAAMQVVGFVPNSPLVGAPGLFYLTYSNDPQGFNVETLQVSRLAAGVFGFREAGLFDRGLSKILTAAAGS
jgi:catechol 2,3-dioxygenase-like lactoylglutathione lyase family enzyme